MGFIDTIKENFNDIFPTPPLYRAVLLGDRAGYFENVVGLKSFCTDEIVVFLKKGQLKINGTNLYIKKFSEGDLVVTGKILAVSLL